MNEGQSYADLCESYCLNEPECLYFTLFENDFVAYCFTGSVIVHETIDQSRIQGTPIVQNVFTLTPIETGCNTATTSANHKSTITPPQPHRPLYASLENSKIFIVRNLLYLESNYISYNIQAHGRSISFAKRCSELKTLASALN